MIFSSFPLRGAILIFVMGVALCFGSCRPRPLITPPSPAESNLFAEAEEDYRQGNAERAMESFALYVERFPNAEKAATALARMAKIQSEAGRHEDALPLLERIVLEYPDHPEAAPSLLELATLFSRLEEYTKSNLKADAFLNRYPDHLLKGEVFLLVGENQSILKDYPAAFAAYLSAMRFMDASDKKAEVRDRILALISEADLEGLGGILPQALGTDFAPPLYHRMALLYLEKGYLQEAREYAMALVRSSEEQQWVDLGREILRKADEGESAAKVIACLLPLTGPFAIYGQEVLKGVQLGLAVGGRFLDRSNQELEVLVRDTQGEPEEAAAQVGELASDRRVLAVIGPLASKTATAAAKKAQELGIPIITLTQKEGITLEGDMVFRNFLTPAREVEEVTRKVAGEMGLRSFGILYPDNAYGRYLLNLFWDRVEELGGSITAVESYKPNQSDVGAEIKKMVGLYHPPPGPDLPADAKPQPIVDFDAVFIPDAAEQIALIAPQFPFHGVFGLRFLGSSLWLSGDLIRTAGDYLQGAVFPSAFFSGGGSEIVKHFVRQYQEDYGTDPGVLAATGHDTILLMRSILGKEDVRTREGLLAALKEVRGVQGVTGHIAFDQNREASNKPTLLSIQGQRIIPLR